LCQELKRFIIAQITYYFFAIIRVETILFGGVIRIGIQIERPYDLENKNPRELASGGFKPKPYHNQISRS
jgi:hypothetical protein